MGMMKARGIGIAFVACLSVGVRASAADLVGTWMSPAPNAYYYPGQWISGYPNSDAFTERFVFTRQNGALVGTFMSMTGERPLNDLKVQGQTISFSQGKNKFHGEIRGNELQLLVNWDGVQGGTAHLLLEPGQPPRGSRASHTTPES